MYNANINQKKVGVAILTSEQTLPEVERYII